MNWLSEIICPLKRIYKVYAFKPRYFGHLPEVPKSCNTKGPVAPLVKLSDGREIPMLGLGTWLSEPGKVEKAVVHAIKAGYRHIDCAHMYENEKEVGEGIREGIKAAGIKRQDLWITSKLWNTFHRPDLVPGALDTTLKNLGLTYLDLYLMHWPMAYREGEGDALAPLDACGKVLVSHVDYVDTWKAMEKLNEVGFVKSLGVANFNKRQLERLLKSAKRPPVINQVECHPYLAQLKLMEFCKSKNIAFACYSPMGSPKRPWAKTSDPKVLEDKEVVHLGKRYSKSPGQILLRYQIERGNIVLTKSTEKSRIEENFNIFDFEMDPTDIILLNNLNRNYRYMPMRALRKHQHHPFARDEY